MDETYRIKVLDDVREARDKISDVIGSGCCSQFDEILADGLAKLADAIETIANHS